MISVLLKRFVHGVIVLWAVATLTFLLLRLAPGGPFDSERKLPPEIIANLEAKYHLNEPVLEQYVRYLAGLAHGDFRPGRVADLGCGFAAGLAAGRSLGRLEQRDSTDGHAGCRAGSLRFRSAA